jgi:hypothetical protein
MLRSVFGAAPEKQNNSPVNIRAEIISTVSMDIKSSLKDSVKKIMKNTTVVETKKYAGESIT